MRADHAAIAEALVRAGEPALRFVEAARAERDDDDHGADDGQSAKRKRDGQFRLQGW
jgi:hypothetical protein